MPMSVASPSPAKPRTAEEIMAMPDDGICRELIRGELREEPRIPGAPKHSAAQAAIAWLLGKWLDQQPEPRGVIHSGGAGFRLCRDPETFVGSDVAYASAELVAQADPNVPFYEGVPLLAIEILSRSDRYGKISERVGLYLEAGAVVWVVDPYLLMVMVHRPGHFPEGLNTAHELSGEPYLPGFRVVVAELFD
jgi:Uma2 family endonuclease